MTQLDGWTSIDVTTPAASWRAPAPRAPRVLPALDARRAASWMLALFDEIDYGVVVLDADLVLLHANRVARARLSRPPLMITGDATLRCSNAEDGERLATALAGAVRRGLRRLLTVGRGAAAIGVSVLPFVPLEGADPVALLLLSRDHVCVPMSIEWYARDHGMTRAEARVLALLCEGRLPAEVAAICGVALSTVRTQISCMRAKTGAASVRQLVDALARLPPMLPMACLMDSGRSACAQRPSEVVPVPVIVPVPEAPASITS